MTHSNSPHTGLIDTLGGLKVFGGIALLVALSREIIIGDPHHFSHFYLNVQLVVCLLFLIDFFVRWKIAASSASFLMQNSLIFILSIPYLNIIVWSGIHLDHDWGMLIGLAPIARALLAFYIVVKWLITRKISRLFAAYVMTVVVFTYLAALIFYNYEAAVNPKLNGFGNALWWAWMNVTTVGAEIFAVTPIGKVITVMLPTLGMMMFPIFTTYIMQRFPPKNKNNSDKNQ